MTKLVAVLAAVLLLQQVPGQAEPEPGPGCDPSRAAVAHTDGGVLLDPQPADLPVPCMTIAGDAIEAATVGVSRSNTVFFASIEQVPFNNRSIFRPTVIARSRDEGASWENRVPGPLPVSTHLSLSTWMHVDHETNRLWYATPTWPCGATISWSDDEGDTWPGYTPNVGCPGMGGAALIEGPPPAGGELPTSAYPHVVYYCALVVDIGGPPVCHRSLDGGRTWQLRGSPDVPPTSECDAPRTQETQTGTVGPDGVLYFPRLVCTGGLSGSEIGLRISRDEGATWQSVPIFRTPVTDLYTPAVAVDAAGAIYVAWRGESSLPYLTRSTDHGATWSPPIMFGAPGASAFRRLGIVAREPGHIAVSYLAAGESGINAYITESRNATDPSPIFTSGAVNPPDQPVYSTGSETFGNRMWFLRGDIADDGTPWAGFHCFNTAPMCPGNLRKGIVGRLAHRG